jgi:serralysin
LGVGQTARGTLATGADHDWYQVSLVAGQTYTFAMTGTGTNNVVNPFLRLYASDGSTVLASNDNGLQGQNSIFTFTAASSGTYYLDAGSASNAYAGQYGVSFTAGTRASFDAEMGAGVIDTDLSWGSTPGGAATVTYAFSQTYHSPTDAQGQAAPFSAFSSTQIAATEQVLAHISELANITFNRVNPAGYSESATMLFTNYSSSTDGAGGFASYPFSTASTSTSGDVRINTVYNSTSALPTGSYSYHVLLHEIGHAIGLSHPGVYNAAPGVSITYSNNAQFTQDTHQYSVMSYFDESNTTSSYGGFTDGMMLLDIYALQQIYGANTSTRSGNTTYGFNSNAGGIYNFATNTSPALSIWDGGGTDTLDLSGFSNTQTIDIREGRFSNVGGFTGNVSIALGAVIENAVGGSGNDTIQGNDAANTLTGNTGNDTIYGGGGGDVLIGGSGVDRLFGEDGDDTIFYDASDDLANVQGGNGTDTLVFTSGSAPSSFALAARGFEGAEGRFTDTGGQPWATRTDYYNTSWQLYQSILTNDDATSQQTTFDIANGQPWSQAITYRNAAGQTTLQSVLNDDNSSQANYFDPTNVQSWSQANTYYNTAGQTTHQSILNDDNTSRTTYYDPTNVQPWASADTFYNTAGQTTLQSVANDNGTTQAQYWDTTNAYNWSTVIHYYNAGGVRTLTTGVYDAGGTFSY